MKSKRLLLMLLMALVVPWAANAQETLTLTVYDNSNTNNYVPTYGNWADAYTKCEFVMPAEDVTNGLLSMTGGTITKMTFYISSASTPSSYATGWDENTFQVFMKEIDATTISAWQGTTNATIVYEGTFANPAVGEYEIEFENGYEYNGGNLLIGVYNTTSGGNYLEASFYGKNVNGASGSYYSSTSLSAVSFTQRNFLPKTTFTYEPAAQGDCEKPETLTPSQITPNTAMLNWEGGSTPGNGYNVEIKGGQYADWNRYASNISQGCLLNHLIENTSYQVRVQTVCSATEASGWKSTNFSTPAYFSNFKVEIVPGQGNKAVFSWTENGFTPSDWQLCINGDETNLISMTSNPFTYDGLTPEAVTTAKMRAFVGDNTGAWSNTVTFTPTDAYVVTVNEGTNTNYNIPFYYYTSYYTPRSQFIVPSTDLATIRWASINKLTFYYNSATSNYGTTDFSVYVTEVNYTTMSAFADWTTLTNVYTGTLSVSGNKMVIEFSTPYTYSGGNLLIGFYTNSTGSSGTYSSWVGTNGTSGCSRYYYSSEGSSSFLPKMTIEYTPGEAPSCLPPTGLDAVAAGQDATFTWESDATQWQVAHATTATANPDDNIVDLVSTKSFTMNDLPLGDHFFWVRTYCSATDQSMWVGPASVHIGYCLPSISNVDNNGFSNVTFGIAPNVVNNDVPKTTYADFTNLVGAVQAGVEATIAITNSTGYDYGTIIWVDLNKNLSFEDNEIMFVGTAPDSSTPYEATITIPATQAVGDYVMRIGGADSSFDSYINGTSSTIPSACFSTSWGTCQDYTLRVLEAPSCLTPTNLVLSRNNNQITATWEGTASTYNIDINGTVIENVTNPYIFTAQLSTTYTVKVQANCTGETSDWSNSKSITTPDCWDGRVIEYTLTDQYNDSWNGAFITIKDACGNLVETLTLPNGASPLNGSLNLCGNYYRFIWNSGSFDSECDFTFTENGQTLFTKPSSLYNGQVLYTLGTQSCPTPTNFTAGTAEARSVALTWNENGEATAWQICLNDDEENLIDVVENVTVNGSVVSYTLTGLTPETTYTIKVRANCGEEQSCWSNDDSFSTIVACPVPTNLDVAEETIEEEKAILTWEAGSEETLWNIQLATYYDATETWSEYVVIAENFNKTTYLIKDLTAGTTYRVQVQAVCGGEFNDMSEWSDYFEFTTVATCVAPTNLAVTPDSETAFGATVTWEGTNDSYILEYSKAITPDVEFDKTYDFEDGTQGWTTIDADGHGDAWSRYTSGGYNNSSASMKATYNSNYAHQDYLVSPQIPLGGTFSFYAKKGGSYTDTFRVYLSTTGNTNASDFSIELTDGDVLPTQTYELYPYDLSSYSGTGYVAIVYTAAADQLSLYVDDIHITASIEGEYGDWQTLENATSPYTFDELDPESMYKVRVKGVCGSSQSQYSNVVKFTTLDACPAPTNFTLGEVTESSAAFSWTQPNNGVEITAWVVKYRKSGDTEWQTLTPNPTVTNATIENLDENSGYEVVIAPACNEEKTLEGEFDTPCAIYTLPYTYGFEDAAEFDCWTMTDCNSSSGIYSSANHSGNKCFYFYYEANSQQCLISPEFNCTTEMGVSFYYKNSSTSYNETFHVGYSTTTNDVDAFTWGDEIFVDKANTSWLVYTNIFPVGTKFVAIKHTSDDAYYLYLDDFTFAEPISLTKEIEPYTGEKDNYYLIASPLAYDVDPVTIDGMTDDNYDLYYFDQAQDLEWRNHKDTEVGGYKLINGKGYLYANSTGNDITFAGVPYVGNGKVGLTYSASATEFMGWNLIGNPFATAATIDRPFYKMNETGDGFTAKIEDLTNTIAAMEGVFVEATATNEIATFTPQASKGGQQAIAQTNIVVSGNKGQVLDNAIIRFDGGQQLGKFSFRQGSTKVFITEEGKDYAVVNAGHVGEIPVSFKAEKNGSYSLSFTSEEVTFSYLHLIDNMTGEDVDLLANPSYSFDAQTTDYANRFKLVFATGSSIDGDSFAFINGMGNLSIFGIEGTATVQVMDVLGHVLSSETFSGSYEKKLNVAPGVYMIRLINGNDVKVQKMIVK